MGEGKWYIFGPCAAESREQVMAVARALKAGEILRAGVWKPRTSPESFQGAGAEALVWLKEAKRECGCDIATEVATPEHVRMALEAGVDYLWIGARTSANPIAVQEIAESLGSKDRCAEGTRIKDLLLPKGVFIKNPVNEDTALWLGNIARLEATGVKVMAVHRGCGHRPCWKMAYELRTARPDIPLLLDPSHMSGDAKKVPELSRKAMVDLGLDGLMVEVHPEPEKALSDAKQQIDTASLPALREQASLPPLRGTLSHKGKGSILQTADRGERLELEWLRSMMDEVDDDLWQVVLRRQEVSRKIGEVKHGAGMEIVQPERWQQVVERRMEWAKENGMNEEEIRTILEAIHRMSVEVQGEGMI